MRLRTCCLTSSGTQSWQRSCVSALQRALFSLAPFYVAAIGRQDRVDSAERGGVVHRSWLDHNPLFPVGRSGGTIRGEQGSDLDFRRGLMQSSRKFRSASMSRNVEVPFPGKCSGTRSGDALKNSSPLVRGWDHPYKHDFENVWQTTSRTRQ